MNKRQTLRAWRAYVFPFFALLGGIFPSPAADVDLYAVAKGRSFIQPDAGAPVPDTNNSLFRFIALVQPHDTDTVVSASVTLPGGSPTLAITNDANGGSQLQMRGEFNDQASLDAAFGAGIYNLAIVGANDGSHLAHLNLTPAGFPMAPHVANWAAAQAIDPAAPFTLTWTPFPGGTTNDLLQVSLDGGNGFHLETPPPGAPGCYNATSNSWTIPGGSFTPGLVVQAQILVVKVVAKDAVDYPGVLGLAGYFAETRFNLQTLNPAGTFALHQLQLHVGEGAGYAQLTLDRLGGSVGSVTVDVATTSGSALAGADFTSLVTTLTFDPGVTSRVFAVEILQDELPEAEEMFSVIIGNPSGGATVGARWITQIFIQDDDSIPSGPDVKFYYLAKGQGFDQFSTNAPVPDTNGPFHWMAGLQQSSFNSVSNASVRIPGGAILGFSPDGNDLSAKANFPTEPAMNAALPPGGYVFHMEGVHDGTNTSTLTLPDVAFPDVPYVLNFNAAQQVDPSSDFVLQWGPWTGGTTNDFVQVEINDDMGAGYRSPSPEDPLRLNGTVQQFVIPAGVLQPGRHYRAAITFANVVQVNTNGYPGVIGLSAYIRRTEFPLQTFSPAGTLQFSLDGLIVSESSLQATVTVVRLGGTEGTVGVSYRTDPGTAQPEHDFGPANGTLVFSGGVSTQTFNVSIVQDELIEGPEFFYVSLSNPTGGATLGALAQVPVVILDDDIPAGPDVRFYLVAKLHEFTQTNSAAAALDSTNGFRFLSFVDGSFPGSVTQAVLRIPGGTEYALQPDHEEWNFKAPFSSSNDLENAFGPGIYRMTIGTLRDGVRAPTLALSAPQYPSAPRVANFDAAQQIDPAADFELSWDPMVGGGAGDYIMVSIDGQQNTPFHSPPFGDTNALNGLSTSVIIPAGTLLPGQPYQASVVFVRPVVINQLGYPGATGVAAYARETRLPIATLVAVPEGRLHFTQPVYTISETGSVVHLTVERSGGSAGAVSVPFATTNLTATAGSDYTAAAGTLDFADGQTNAIIDVPILDDALAEPWETFRVDLGHPTGGAILGVIRSALVVIIDDETTNAGSFQFTLTNIVVQESGPSAALTVVRTGGLSNPATVDLATADETALDGFDYRGTNVTLTFNPGELNKTIVIPILNDSIDEPTETFVAALSNPTGGATLGPRSLARVSIVDNDDPGKIGFGAATYSVSETGVVVAITLVRTSGNGASAGVSYATADGTATGDVDYGITSGTVYFASNELSRTITIPILDDIEAEGDETFQVLLTDPTGGAALGPITNTVVTILDNEVTLAFSSDLYTNAEGGTGAAITVTRTGPTTAAASVDVTSLDGSATAPDDYTAVTTNLTIAAGQSSKTFNVPILNDNLVEGDETFSLLLSNPTGAQLGEIFETTVVIKDNDQGGTISFALTNFTVSEFAPVVSVTLLRAGGKAGGVIVHLTSEDDTATDGLDYIGISQDVEFGPNEIRKTVPVTIINDALAELNETFRLVLSEPSGGAVIGDRSSATVTILDNDRAGTVGFPVTSYTVNETNSTATLVVTRVGGSAGGVQVSYTTVDGTALAGSDYTATSGTLIFGSNELSKTIVVPITDDQIAEGDEAFRVVLSDAQGGAVLSVSTNAVVTIRDNEASVQFSSVSYTNSEAIPAALITVVRGGFPGSAITVHVDTSDGSAIAGSDYRAVSTNLTIPAGAVRASFLVPILNDTLVEETESLQLTLSNPVGAQLGVRSNALLYITDNDSAGVLQLSVTNVIVSETSGFAKITVLRAGGLASGVTVQFDTADLTATAGADYTAVSTNLVFAAGELKKTVSVPILTDDIRELAEQFSVTLSSPTGGATLGPRTNGIVNINNVGGH